MHIITFRKVACCPFFLCRKASPKGALRVSGPLFLCPPVFFFLDKSEATSLFFLFFIKAAARPPVGPGGFAFYFLPYGKLRFYKKKGRLKKKSKKGRAALLAFFFLFIKVFLLKNKKGDNHPDGWSLRGPPRGLKILCRPLGFFF
jgi:hypothetical protein